MASSVENTDTMKNNIDQIHCLLKVLIDTINKHFPCESPSKVAGKEKKKRYPNGFNLFVKSMVAAGPDKVSMTVASQAYKNLSDDEKAKWQEKAAALKLETIAKQNSNCVAVTNNSADNEILVTPVHDPTKKDKGRPRDDTEKNKNVKKSKVSSANEVVSNVGKKAVATKKPIVVQLKEEDYKKSSDEEETDEENGTESGTDSGDSAYARMMKKRQNS